MTGAAESSSAGAVTGDVSPSGVSPYKVSPHKVSPDGVSPNGVLPYGVVTDDGNRNRRVSVRVGDDAVDLGLLARRGVLTATDPALVSAPDLGRLIGAGPDAWRALREELGAIVANGDHEAGVLAPGWTAVLPVRIGDYVDFYSSIEHATNLGRLFRPDGEPLLPNWRHLPIGYHGRSGTVVVSGTPIRRPHGQWKAPGETAPRFGPSQRLDIELELGAVLSAGGPSAAGARGRSEPFDPEQHLFGLVLVNDWSARDIQAWEYQPLGPFLGKSFATSISAWVVPWPALEPYRVEAPGQDPEPLPYLTTLDRYGLDIELTVEIQPAGSDRFVTLSTTNAADLYWSFGQQLAHLRSNGAGIGDGDLIATGTISGSVPGSEGSLIELTRAGARPVELAGRALTFLEDGDTIRLSGRLGGRSLGAGAGPSIGECVGRIVP